MQGAWAAWAPAAAGGGWPELEALLRLVPPAAAPRHGAPRPSSGTAAGWDAVRAAFGAVATCLLQQHGHLEARVEGLVRRACHAPHRPEEGEEGGGREGGGC